MTGIHELAVRGRTVATKTMSQEHKDALAVGRARSKAVKAYLEALEETRPKRGQHASSLEVVWANRVAIASRAKLGLSSQEAFLCETEKDEPQHRGRVLGGLKARVRPQLVCRIPQLLLNLRQISCHWCASPVGKAKAQLRAPGVWPRRAHGKELGIARRTVYPLAPRLAP